MKINKAKCYKVVEQITPPIILKVVKKASFYKLIKRKISGISKPEFNPCWNIVSGGPLKGKNIFVDPSGGMQSDMIRGVYDDFVFDYLQTMNLVGKTIFDIGAHIGYSSMCFAELVGDSGTVVSFEPNIFNAERIEKNLDKNPELRKRVRLQKQAISNSTGKEEFIFSSNIENGTSSGGFIESADTFLRKNVYEDKLGFKRVLVDTVSLDDILTTFDLRDMPSIIKIDIEGAEHLVFSGGKKFFETCKPLLLIEVHSIFNMFKIGEYLRDLDYKIELLKEEADGRCFFVASSI